MHRELVVSTPICARLFAGREDSFRRNRRSLGEKDIHCDAEKQREYEFLLLEAGERHCIKCLRHGRRRQGEDGLRRIYIYVVEAMNTLTTVSTQAPAVMRKDLDMMAVEDVY